MSELQPVKCGCGGEARIGKIYGDAWTVECTECGIQSGCYDTEVQAVTAWNKAIGVKDINVPNKGFWKPVYASEATGFDPSLAGCDPVFNHVCSICGQEPLADDLGEEYLSYFCPHCGADMRHEDIPMEYFENGGI